MKSDQVSSISKRILRQNQAKLRLIIEHTAPESRLAIDKLVKKVNL